MKKFLFVALLCMLLLPQSTFAFDSKDVPLRADLIIERINSQRTANNLPVFKQNEALMRAAALKVQDIASRGVLEHTKVSSNGLWWPLESTGYVYESAGENLSEGVEDSALLVTDWMDSPEHRVNILNEKYTEIGVAIARGMFQGEEVSFVVEYTAKPKSIVLTYQTTTPASSLVTPVSSQLHSPSISTALTGTSELEMRKKLMIQLIALLTEYLNLLVAQKTP